MPSEPLSPVGRTLVTTFGLGHLRPASGTWGSMPTVVIAACLLVCGARPCGDGLWPSVIYHGVLLAVLVVFSWACVMYGDGAEVYFGKKDPGSVVADETAGQAIALFALPAAATATPGRALISLGLAFLAFRLCDIVKAWPARGWQRYPGGWGILIDDLVAGVQALVIVQVAVRAMWVW
ncbi:MAG TPA: phosphatidylglycerophosphatase A [Phycisphaerales bacterium]|nr:phosphatidylglycerophosphatase A [Phycisphaerales bacterium]